MIISIEMWAVVAQNRKKMECLVKICSEKNHQNMKFLVCLLCAYLVWPCLEVNPNGKDLLYHHAKYGGDLGSSVGCRLKSVSFCFFCLRDKLCNCDNRNAVKQCNFQNNYGVIA